MVLTSLPVRVVRVAMPVDVRLRPDQAGPVARVGPVRQRLVASVEVVVQSARPSSLKAATAEPVGQGLLSMVPVLVVESAGDVAIRLLLLLSVCGLALVVRAASPVRAALVGTVA